MIIKRNISTILNIYLFLISIMITAFLTSCSMQSYELEDMRLNYSSFHLAVGAERQLALTFFPEYAVPASTIWTSSNISVVEVSDEGLVKAISFGTAVITVEDSDGMISCECEITVDSDLEKILVDINTAIPGYGDSWDSAFTDLQQAIDYAWEKGIPEVWIADGTYETESYPWTDDYCHIALRNNLKIYGGFKGGESSIEERDYSKYKSIIGTRIYNPASAALDETSVLDGVYISGADGMQNTDSSPFITNTVFTSYWDTLDCCNAGSLFENCTFSCSAIEIENSSISFSDCSFNLSDGSDSFSADESIITFSDCDFSDSTSYSSYLDFDGTKLAIENCHFDGVGINFKNENDNEQNLDLLIKDSYFENIRYRHALLFAEAGAKLEIENCSFNNNASTSSLVYVQWTSESNITDCEFIDNDGGRAIYYNGYPEDTVHTLSGCTFRGNSAGVLNIGYSIYYISDCKFEDNSTPYWGGTIYSYMAELQVTDCDFINNHNLNDDGGAVYIGGFNAPVPIFTDCYFYGNTAARYGGAISAYSAPYKVSGCTFENNTAVFGGALYIDDWHSSTSSWSLVDRCIFRNNQADYGGAIYSYDDNNLYVKNSLLYNNYAEYSGGGIFLNYINLTLLNCTLIGNSTSENGGGLYLSNGSNLYLRNSILSDNTAGNGAQIYMLNEDAPSSVASYYSIIKTDIDSYDSDDGDFDMSSYSTFICDPELDTDFIPIAASPARDNGNGSYLFDEDLLDLAGNPRENGTVDVGAIEYW